MTVGIHAQHEALDATKQPTATKPELSHPINTAATRTLQPLGTQVASSPAVCALQASLVPSADLEHRQHGPSADRRTALHAALTLLLRPPAPAAQKKYHCRAQLLWLILQWLDCC